jgi:hypothetical protein
MEISLTNIKRHIVAELLIIRLALERNTVLPDAAQTFWIYYRQELKATGYDFDAIINSDEEMAAFHAEWEEYNTYLPQEETRLPVITLAMKLVMAKALKYADDATLATMLASINEKLRLNQNI